jgi:RNA polymerase sigma-70 factor, ECF subfamily
VHRFLVDIGHKPSGGGHVDPQNGQERDRTMFAQAELPQQPDVTAGDAQASAPLPRPAGSQEPEPEPGAQSGILAALSAGRYDEALRLCAGHHGEALGRLCMSLVGSQTDAEDLVQETLLAAYQGFGGYREQGSVKAWLCSIARRKCARHLELRSRPSRGALPAPQPAPSAEEQVVAHRRAVRARVLLESIRPSEREALVLRYAAGLSFREVAQACGIEEAAARKRASRALAALRTRLSAEE